MFSNHHVPDEEHGVFLFCLFVKKVFQKLDRAFLKS